MPWPCFMIVPTDRARRYLRRYRYGSSDSSDACPTEPGQYSYHHAMTRIEDGHLVVDADGCYRGEESAPGAFRGDPRWPAQCQCGYVFADDDQWQVFVDQIYVRQDNPRIETTLRDAPIGAMWDAYWMRWDRGPDGIALVVQTPGGEWMPDGPSHPRGGGEPKPHAWTRTGTLPNVTVTPSISIGDPERYHGFLTGGQLTDDLGQHTYLQPPPPQPIHYASERSELEHLRAERARGATTEAA